MRRVHPLRRIYRRLRASYGPQGWWPAGSPAEMAVGAVLTQHTAWPNAARAVGRLRSAGLLDWPALHARPAEEIARLVRPAGAPRVKSARLRALARFLVERHGGSLEAFLRSGATASLRESLLSVHGVGPETADAILLYAGDHPSFVVDAYTCRVLRRHGVLRAPARYEEVQRLFHEALPRDPELWKEYHALFVELGKRHCRPRARCEACPLAALPHDGRL